MREEWTGEVIKAMHLNEIGQADIAEEMGVTKSYVSMLLNGARKVEGAREKIEAALQRALEKKYIA